MKNKISKIILPIFGIIALNLLASFVFFRLDMTEEKRYSISDATKSLLQNLDNEVFVKVYLAGNDLPNGFERLKRAVEETLDEFKVHGGTKINYKFIDPNTDLDGFSVKEKFVEDLELKGIIPTNAVDKKNGRTIETLVFPYVSISYGEKSKTVLLLKSNENTKNAQEKLNQSYENIEFELASVIRKLTLKEKKKIGLLAEFTRLKPKSFADVITSLQDNYDLFIINTKLSPTFVGLDAIVLPKPDFPVDDSTKFKIDQYIINGGKALFFVDGLKVDSVSLEGNYAQPLQHNLEDLFFKYGVRINNNIVKDGQNCASIPMVVGNMGDKPNIQPIPYRFYPIINNFGKSLITNNLDLIYTKFVASIDTVKADGILKSPLLMTSPYTKVLNAPAFVSYNEARTETDQNDYNQGVKTIAYLLEGKFESLYKNRLLPSDARFEGFKAQNLPAKIIVCSDGDLIVNEINPKNGNPLPLGLDKTTGHVFGNKDFMLHAIDYLIDENGVIAARGKEVKLRPLDKLKVRDERSKWQIFNLILPLGILGIFGGLRWWWRKKKYE